MKQPTLKEVKEYFKNVKTVMGFGQRIANFNNLDERGIHLWEDEYYVYDRDNMNVYVWSEAFGYSKIIEYKPSQSFKKLNKRVVKFAKKNEILKKATPLSQLDKTIEEVLELREALVAQNNNLETYVNSKGVVCNTKEQIIDGIGDIDVTMKIQCKMQNLKPLRCLESVLDIIEKRTGKMEDGKFKKDN